MGIDIMNKMVINNIDKYLKRMFLSEVLTSKDIPQIQMIIDIGVDINIKIPRSRSNKPGFCDDWTMLIYASYHRQSEIVSLLLKQPNIDVNFQDSDGYTALIRASFWGDDNIMKQLLFRTDTDIFLKINDKDYNFIDIYEKCSNHRQMGRVLPGIGTFLEEYDVQKKIIEVNQKNILLFDQYNLVHPKIKEEHSDLFNANNWGLI